MTESRDTLGLARAAFQAALPGETELTRAARRLSIRERVPRRRRLVPALALLVLLCAVLAYAASQRLAGSAGGDREPLAPAGAVVARAPREEPAKPVAERPELGEPPATPASRASADPRAEQRVPRDARPRGGWRDVTEALGRGDRARALAMLERIATAGQGSDRAIARLEMARLSAGAGDCRRARELLRQAASLAPSEDRAGVARARTAIETCERRAAGNERSSAAGTTSLP